MNSNVNAFRSALSALVSASVFALENDRGFSIGCDANSRPCFEVRLVPEMAYQDDENGNRYSVTSYSVEIHSMAAKTDLAALSANLADVANVSVALQQIVSDFPQVIEFIADASKVAGWEAEKLAKRHSQNAMLLSAVFSPRMRVTGSLKSGKDNAKRLSLADIRENLPASEPALPMGSYTSIIDDKAYRLDVLADGSAYLNRLS